MSGDRQVDANSVRQHIETVIDGCEQVFEKFFLAKFLGLNFEYLPNDAEDINKEICRLSFEVNEMIMNPQGTLHGGIIATVMDISIGHLLQKTLGPGVTIEMKIQYLRSVAKGVATVEGRFIKKGRSINFMESRLFGGDGKLAATMTATFKLVD